MPATMTQTSPDYHALPNHALTQRVTIVDIDVPFLSLVVLLIKLVVASLPAAVVVYFTYGVIYTLATHPR